MARVTSSWPAAKKSRTKVAEANGQWPEHLRSQTEVTMASSQARSYGSEGESTKLVGESREHRTEVVKAAEAAAKAKQTEGEFRSKAHLKRDSHKIDLA
uniref:Uncharacterized protein n=1 Tax=Sphaerodactylus townsendi TaxID=933632 RepID=A0ACB8F6B5_9SAUR